MTRQSILDWLRVTFIYGLRDPRSGEIRYVGKANNPRVRLYRHNSPSSKKKNHCFDWLRCLKGMGLKPILFTIEAVPVSDWEEAERFWIAYFKQKGCRLVNATGGGDGVSDVTPETRAKLKAIALARPKPSFETRQKMSKSHKARQTLGPWNGKSLSKEHRENIARAQKKRWRRKKTAKNLGLRAGIPTLK